MAARINAEGNNTSAGKGWSPTQYSARCVSIKYTRASIDKNTISKQNVTI